MAPDVTRPPSEDLADVAATSAGTVRVDFSPERARVLARMIGRYSQATVDATTGELERSSVAADVAKILGTVEGWHRREWVDLGLDLLNAAARIDQLGVPVVRRPVSTDTIAEALT